MKMSRFMWYYLSTGITMAFLMCSPKIVWICIGLHLVADYWMQGCLADMKQKDWWIKKFDEFNLDDKHRELYKFDYNVALFCHATMWSIITFSPFVFFIDSFGFSVMIFTNILVHAFVDTLKANAKVINLADDQIIHLIQIVGSAWLITNGFTC